MTDDDGRISSAAAGGHLCWGKSHSQYHLPQVDWAGVHQLVEERYAQWDWNYGRSPKFNVQRTHRFAFGEIDARIDVQHGAIESIKFYGDFLGNGEMADLEAALTGVRYDVDALLKALARIDVEEYFGGITLKEVAQFLYG